MNFVEHLKKELKSERNLGAQIGQAIVESESFWALLEDNINFEVGRSAANLLLREGRPTVEFNFGEQGKSIEVPLTLLDEDDEAGDIFDNYEVETLAKMLAGTEELLKVLGLHKVKLEAAIALDSNLA